MEDLERVETRVSRVGKGRSTTRYFLLTRSGEEQRISNSSGIKLTDVVAELERLGVPHELINVKKTKKAKRAKKAQQTADSTNQQAAYHA